MKRSVGPTLTGLSEVRGRHLLVAVSGGADSTALVCLLAEQRAACSLRLTVAHIEHGIRGADSLEDAASVARLCERLELPLLCEHVDVPAAARESGEGTETVARRLRYEALRRMRAASGAELIALAHHRDDQAETVLMHLLRGAGASGASGMRVREGDLYRPLLDCSKAELLRYLNERRIPWREDRTNLLPDNPRNRLRLELIPALRTLYPGMDRALCRFAESSACDERHFSRELSRYLSERHEAGPYGQRILSPETIPEPILRRMLSACAGFPIEHDRLLEAISLIGEKHGQRELGRGFTAVRSPTALYLQRAGSRATPEVPLPSVGEVQFSDLGRFTITPAEPIPIRDDPNAQVLDAEAVKDCVLRLRRKADRIRPLGCGDRLLSDVFTDRRVELPIRDTVPLLARGGRILWIVGHTIGEEAKLTVNTRSAVRIEWHPVEWRKQYVDEQ